MPAMRSTPLLPGAVLRLLVAGSLLETVGCGNAPADKAPMQRAGTLQTLRVPWGTKWEDPPPVVDQDLKEIGTRSTLTELYIYESRITDSGLKHLAGLVNLKVLELHAPAVTDAGLEQLTGLKNLLVLKLGETQVTRAGVERFQRALPQCDVRVEWPAEVPDRGPVAP